MKKGIIILITLITAGAFIYTSCSKDEDDLVEDLVSIAVSPEDVYFEPGSTQQYIATGTLADGTTRDITDQVEWKSTNESVATISATGLATGVSAGQTFISASNGLTLGSATANVLSGGDLERTQMIQDYNTNYLGSENADCAWTGDEASCQAGTISSASYDKVIQRVNYFRRLCGLSDSIYIKNEYSQKCQIAALMFRANNTISHYPPSDWDCFDADGAEAAANSNIAIGFHTTSAVTAYIEDFGDNNLAVGHRRWILYTKANAMGEGSTPNTEALWVFDHLSSAPAGTPDYITYPSEGYFPAPLVFPRWSFMMPQATFSNTEVEMTDQDGNSVPLTIIYRYESGGLAGEPAIVWEPTGIETNSPDDMTYTVNITQIGGGGQTSVTYDVTIVQPNSTKMMTDYERVRKENPNARVM